MRLETEAERNERVRDRARRTAIAIIEGIPRCDVTAIADALMAFDRESRLCLYRMEPQTMKWQDAPNETGTRAIPAKVT